MSALLETAGAAQPVPTTTPGSGRRSGPEGKRAYGGQFVAQSLAAACRTVESDRLPTNMHLQFLRGGEAGDPVEYTVHAGVRRPDRRGASGRLPPGRPAADDGDGVLRRALPGPEHGMRASMPDDPESLPRTGPAGPAPSMPLDELDIRIVDDDLGGEFVRRFWWRATVPSPTTRWCTPWSRSTSPTCT